MSPEHADFLLWSDRRPFQERYEKSAAALLAVREVLSRHRPLQGGEDEFLSLLAWAEELPADVFTAVWKDPAAYWWVRMAYQFVGLLVAGTPLGAAAADYCRATNAHSPAAALEHHLQDFKRFVLALAVLGERDMALDRPLEAMPPMAIPGTDLYLEAPRPVRVLGCSGRSLTVEYDGKRRQFSLAADVAGEPVRVARCPEATTAGCRVRLMSALFNLPGLDFGSPLRGLDGGYQRSRLSLLEAALAQMARYAPETFAQFRDYTQVVAMKPLSAGGFTNLSYSDLPNAFIAGTIEEPAELADSFIHEFHHDRLFFLEEAGPYFEDSADNALERDGFYSPWRDDLRPAHGILHAVYVHVPVIGFWLALHADAQVPAALHEYAAERVARFLWQLDLGIHQLRRHVRFTDYGQALFDGMCRAVEAQRARATAEVISDRVAALTCNEGGGFRTELSALDGRALSVREAIAEHVQRFDRHAQCAAVLERRT